MYCKCAGVDVARRLFDEMPQKDVVSFSILISASSRCGEPRSALLLAVQLQEQGLRPNEFVFSSAIASCGRLDSVSLGKQLHAQAVVFGLQSDPFVAASLIDVYSGFSDVESAVSVFSLCPSWDPAVVNSMVSGLVESGLYQDALELLRDAWHNSDFRFTNYSFVYAIKACRNLDQNIPKQIHCLSVKSGCHSNCFVAASLIDLYGKFGDVDSMEKAFLCVTSSDLALYNALIVNLTQNGFYSIALKYFRELKFKGYSPDECSFSSVLKACGGSRSLTSARVIHGNVETSIFRKNLVVNTALIDAYMKCRRVEESLDIFFRMNKRRSTISYNTMISGFGQNGKPEEAMSFFLHMNHNQVRVDLATYVVLIGSCMGHEWAIYTHAIKQGFGCNPMVQNVLLDNVLKRGAIDDALDIFHKMEESNVVSWTTAISGLTRLGFYQEAIKLFKVMTLTKISPNLYTFSSALKACGHMARLELGRNIHAYILKHGLIDNEFIGCSILDVYANCGALEESHKVFCKLPRRDLVSWNTIISSYASHGYGQMALDLYAMMSEEGIEPNHVTFVSLLSACSHSGLVEKGVQLFDLMSSKHGIKPCLEHYACMVDMFGRAGLLDKAKTLLDSMQFQANVAIWAAFLSACRIHGNVELARYAEENILIIGGEDAQTHVLMYNVHSEVGNWTDAEKSRMRLGASGVRKEPGVSWMQTI